jgi:LmbE family N-acetylglucosaminyl deacetylase
MKTFISDLKQYWEDRPFIWSEFEDVFTRKVRLPTYGKVLILGPHPDDPESVAITSRTLMRLGCDIWTTIVSISPSGVEDEYAQRWQNNDSISSQNKKIEIRRREQTLATEMFGLTPDRLTFLGIEENKGLDNPNSSAKIRDHLLSIAPDIVIMPIGKDLNQTHAWVYKVFRECAEDLILKKEKSVVALYNEDPKTFEIRHDLFVLFGEESADWKRALLRIHDSQQQRNIHSRDMGFDKRILHMNHLSYRRLQEILPHADGPANYAEVFEIELFDFPPLRAK